MSRYLIDEEDESIDDLILHGYVKQNFNNNKEESSETHSGYSPERGDDADYEQIESVTETKKQVFTKSPRTPQRTGFGFASHRGNSFVSNSPEKKEKIESVTKTIEQKDDANDGYDPADDDEPEIGNISPTTPKEFKEDPIKENDGDDGYGPAEDDDTNDESAPSTSSKSKKEFTQEDNGGDDGYGPAEDDGESETNEPPSNTAKKLEKSKNQIEEECDGGYGPAEDDTAESKVEASDTSENQKGKKLSKSSKSRRNKRGKEKEKEKSNKEDKKIKSKSSTEKKSGSRRTKSSKKTKETTAGTSTEKTVVKIEEKKTKKVVKIQDEAKVEMKKPSVIKISYDSASSDSESDSEDEDEANNEIDEQVENIKNKFISDAKKKGEDWNKEFQDALNLQDGPERWESLSTIARDFVYCSKMYGKIIISEYNLPIERKTIPPIDAGGRAGGMKYIAANIFFKFALDTADELGVWMYGGNDRPFDSAAMKGASNDMLGLQSYFNSNVSGLHYPLMSIIDYRGFRLLAMTILPIKKDTTLLYGSRDAGKHVYNKNSQLAAKMKQVGKSLGLKGHKVLGATQTTPTKLYAPIDIEAHLGEDNRFYVLDFGRVFPPEVKGKPTREIFWKLLRPEFVRSYGTKLSSDACSGFGRIDSNIHNTNIRRATNHLHQVIIPKFIREQLSTLQKFNTIRLTERLHSAGINCRHLGIIRKLVDTIPLRKILLSEILARTLTFLLRKLLRDEMAKQVAARQEPYKRVAFRVLQAVFSPLPFQKKERSVSMIPLKDSTLLTGSALLRSPLVESNINTTILSSFNDPTPTSKPCLIPEEEHAEAPTTPFASHQINSVEQFHDKDFWSYKIKHIIQERFAQSLSEAELNSTEDIRKHIDMVAMITRFTEQAGILLRSRVLSEYQSDPVNFKLMKFDLRTLRVRVRHLNVIDEAEGNLLAYEAKTHSTFQSGIWDAVHSKFASAVSSNTNNFKTYITWGILFFSIFFENS